MRVILEKKVLQKKLQLAQNIVGGKVILPMLSSILVFFKDQNVSLLSTDLNLYLVSKIKAQTLNEGKFVIRAQKFIDIVREMSGDSIEIEKENQFIVIRSEKAVFKLLGMEPDEFPPLPIPEGEVKKVRIKEVILRNMIRKVAYAAVENPGRDALPGALLSVKKDKVIMVGIDGFRFAYAENKLEKPIEGDLEVVIPARTMGELLKVLENVQDETEISLDEKNRLFFSFRGDLLISKVIEEKYTNYQQIIPKRAEVKVIVETEKMISIIRRISILSLNKSIKIDLRKNLMKISAYLPEVGEANEEIEVNYQGEEIGASFSAQYLLDVLRNVDSPQFVLEFLNKKAVLVIRPDSREIYFCLIMPMRAE